MNDSQITKNCCFAGHKKIPDEKVEFVEQELRREIDDALKAGYMHFICGFDDGAPLLFAKIVAEKRSENPSIKLEAAIAYRNKVSSLQKNGEANKILAACSIIGVHGEKYSKDALVIRNRSWWKAQAG